jgi:hypothetical protein
MPEQCTCGAQLPPDALFCHKCGKPQREITVPEPVFEAPEEFVPRTPPATVRIPVSFRTPAAWRIAVPVSVGATLLSQLIPVITWAAAGFLTVFFYRRKTGMTLTVKEGLKLGWITGLLTSTFVGTFLILLAATGMLGPMLVDVAQKARPNDPTFQQMSALLQTGAGTAYFVILMLIASFLFITVLSMAGGALGAKMVGGD